MKDIGSPIALKLDEQHVGAIMTTGQDIFVIDFADESHEVKGLIADCPYSRAVICRDGLDNVLAF